MKYAKPIPAIITILAVLYSLWTTSASAATTLLDIDFGASSTPVHLQDKGVFEGVLPEGFNAVYPQWNNSKATSTLLTENGIKFLRISLQVGGTGEEGQAAAADNVVFSCPLPGATLTPGYYQLTIAFRSDCGEIPVCLRQMVGSGDKPDPHQGFFWAAIPAATKAGAWSKRTFTFYLNKGSTVPVGVYLYHGTFAAGDCDLATLKLSQLTSEEYQATMNRPEAGTANFFRNSRLPLALDAGTVSVNPTEKGPSGYSALQLASASGRQTALNTEPFQTSDPSQKNSVSVAFKGTGQWQLSVLCQTLNGAREVAVKPLTPSGSWQTETIEFTPDEIAGASRAFALKIEGTGTIFLDSFQAWAGSGPRPYTPQGEGEVALSLPDSEVSDTRIQFSDAPALINYLATGNLTGATLKLQAFNAYGQAQSLPDIPLAGTSDQQAGQASFDVFPQAMLGQFRIEAWIERGGRRISPCNEILVARLRRPIHLTEDAPNSPFGAHFEPDPLTIKMMKAAGINWVRTHDAATKFIAWNDLEPEKGVWNFHDEELNRYRQNHIKIYAGLETTPRWAAMAPGPSDNEFKGFFQYSQPQNLDDWTEYVRTVVTRYKGVIDSYFIGNEVWSASYWHRGYDPIKKTWIAGPDPAGDYVKACAAAYQTIKAIDPSIQVEGFNGHQYGGKWTKAVFDAGGNDYCDVLDYHYYSPESQAQPGDQARSFFNDAVGYVKQKVPSLAKPVYMSEGQGNITGFRVGGVEGSCGLYHRTVPWDLTPENHLIGPDKNTRYVVATLASGAAKVFLYSAHCYSSLLSPGSDLALVGPDGYPSIELAAFSNLAWHLEEKKFALEQPLDDKVSAYLFEGKEGTTAIISGRRNGTYHLPVSPDLKVTDLFGNPLPGPAEYQGYLLYVDSPLPSAKLAATLAGK
jgi:hypothetical protein